MKDRQSALRASTQAYRPGLRSGLALSAAVCAVSKPMAPDTRAPWAHMNERAAFANDAGQVDGPAKAGRYVLSLPSYR